MSASSHSAKMNSSMLLDGVKILVVGRNLAMDRVADTCGQLGGTVAQVAHQELHLDSIENYDAVIMAFSPWTTIVERSCKANQSTLISVESSLEETLGGNLISLQYYRANLALHADLQSLKLSATLRKETASHAGPESRLLWQKKARRKKLF
jgi:hypothetical protein